jgi:stage II sporulation protein M
LGFSIIGLILNIFVIYLKGFIVGFTISSMILTYGAKGILSSLIYLLFGQLINIFVIIIIGIYGFMFSLNLLKLIFNKKKDNGRKMMKKYIIILIICIVISFISSVLESFVLPNILKFIIGIYVS